VNRYRFREAELKTKRILWIRKSDKNWWLRKRKNSLRWKWLNRKFLIHMKLVSKSLFHSNNQLNAYIVSLPTANNLILYPISDWQTSTKTVFWRKMIIMSTLSLVDTKFIVVAMKLSCWRIRVTTVSCAKEIPTSLSHNTHKWKKK
jgi:hypothetical protein